MAAGEGRGLNIPVLPSVSVPLLSLTMAIAGERFRVLHQQIPDGGYRLNFIGP